MIESRTYLVVGRVQGVGFRWFVLDAALGLDLAGWVANEADGSVRVVAEGRRADLEALELDQSPRPAPGPARPREAEEAFQQALQELAKRQIEARVDGEGAVVKQSPEPGRLIEPGMVCFLLCSRGSSGGDVR